MRSPQSKCVAPFWCVPSPPPLCSRHWPRRLRSRNRRRSISTSSNGVSTYSVDATTGALTLVNAAPTSSAPVLAGPLVINSAGTYLFNIGLNSANQGAVFVYSIAPNGSLQQTAASPFAISQPTGTPFALALSQNGNYLYVLSSYPATQPQPGNDTQYTEIFVDVFSVAADGTLTIANTIPIPDPDYCNSDLMASTTPVAFDVHPAQKWIYVSMSAHEAGGSLCTGEPSAIQQLIINADGTLSDGQLYVLGTYSTPVSGFASSPDGTQLFMLGGLSLTPFLNAIAINPVSGQLNGSSDYTTSGSYNGALAVDWSSSYLYNSTFGTFSISDGNLQLLSNPPPQAPTGLATSSIVPFLFNLEDGEVGVYQVGAGDTLTQVSGSPFTVTQGTQVLSGSPALVDTAVLWVSPGESVGFGGPVQVGQSTTYPVGLTNQGYGPLTVSNVSVSGDPSFSVTNTCSAPVATCRELHRDGQVCSNGSRHIHRHADAYYQREHADAFHFRNRHRCAAADSRSGSRCSIADSVSGYHGRFFFSADIPAEERFNWHRPDDRFVGDDYGFEYRRLYGQQYV